MALQYSTPGVYIQELDAFPHSIVAVPTAIPAFIGYTQFATDENGQSLSGIPHLIQSQTDYETYFGTGFKSVFPVTPAGVIDGSKLGTVTRFYLYDSIRLFYANGGGECYIVSIGNYTTPPADPVAVLTDPLNTATGSLLQVEDATMVLIPDAVALTEIQAYNQVYTAVLAHCAFMQSRMGIFDLVEPDDDTFDGLATKIATFRTQIGINSLNYGTAYFPWLESGVVPSGEVDFGNISTPIALAGFLSTFGDSLNPGAPVNAAITAIVNTYLNDPSTADLAAKTTALTNATTDLATKQTAVTNAAATLAKANAANPQVPADITSATTALRTANTNLTNSQTAFATAQNNFNLSTAAAAPTRRAFQLAMIASSATYKALMGSIVTALSLLPPSGAIAGVYTSVDNSRGVWKAPANVSLNSVAAPSADFNRNMTDSLNVDAATGKSINAIRSFPGIGTLVFGGRTLDGNSQDWRYINVRRTLIMMEQSIKLALRAYVFEPNDDSTWITVKSMISNFLTNLWKQGALAGTKPEDAFQVMCGLNVTMTAQDILDGYMRVSVLVAVVHPAEFIVLTFQQELQTS
jgi:phage tail sheath protein FI